MESNQALYYPYIHFKKDAWVKVSALYWDKIKRIVPHDYPTEDSALVQALGSVIERVDPGEADHTFATTFREFISGYGAKLQQTYDLDNRHLWPVIPPELRPPLAGGPSGQDPRLGYVRYEKVNHDLYSDMTVHRLAMTDGGDSRWIGMHPRLASVYMHALAEHIAKRKGLRPLTDETFDHVALSQLSLERLANALLGDVALVDARRSATEVESALVSVAFRTLVPVDLDALSARQILSFRETYPNERHRFQSAVDDLLKSRGWLLSIDDPDVLQERLRDEIEAPWTEELRALKEKLNDVGIRTMFSCANLTTTLPTAISGGIGMLGLASHSMAAGTAAVALAAIPMLRSQRQAARAEVDKLPVAYLWRMEQDLQPKELQGWWRQGLRRFLPGT